MIRKLSEIAEEWLSHPVALIVYGIVSVLLSLWLNENAVTLILSHFANCALILLNIASRRAMCKMEKQLDALAEVNPRVDHDRIARDAGA